MAGQREILSAYGGVKLSDVRGMRAPFLSIGGNKMFKMLYDSNFTYDSSMPVYENRPPSWPYTLDYKIFHDCMIPPCPTKSYPGMNLNFASFYNNILILLVDQTEVRMTEQNDMWREWQMENMEYRYSGEANNKYANHVCMWFSHIYILHWILKSFFSPPLLLSRSRAHFVRRWLNPNGERLRARIILFLCSLAHAAPDFFSLVQRILFSFVCLHFCRCVASADGHVARFERWPMLDGWRLLQSTRIRWRGQNADEEFRSTLHNESVKNFSQFFGFDSIVESLRWCMGGELLASCPLFRNLNLNIFFRDHFVSIYLISFFFRLPLSFPSSSPAMCPTQPSFRISRCNMQSTIWPVLPCGLVYAAPSQGRLHPFPRHDQRDARCLVGYQLASIAMGARSNAHITHQFVPAIPMWLLGELCAVHARRRKAPRFSPQQQGCNFMGCTVHKLARIEAIAHCNIIP